MPVSCAYGAAYRWRQKPERLLRVSCARETTAKRLKGTRPPPHNTRNHTHARVAYYYNWYAVCCVFCSGVPAAGSKCWRNKLEKRTSMLKNVYTHMHNMHVLHEPPCGTMRVCVIIIRFPLIHRVPILQCARISASCLHVAATGVWPLYIFICASLICMDSRETDQQHRQHK